MVNDDKKKTIVTLSPVLAYWLSSSWEVGSLFPIQLQSSLCSCFLCSCLSQIMMFLVVKL